MKLEPQQNEAGFSEVHASLGKAPMARVGSPESPDRGRALGEGGAPGRRRRHVCFNRGGSRGGPHTCSPQTRPCHGQEHHRLGQRSPRNEGNTDRTPSARPGSGDTGSSRAEAGEQASALPRDADWAAPRRPELGPATRRPPRTASGAPRGGAGPAGGSEEGRGDARGRGGRAGRKGSGPRCLLRGRRPRVSGQGDG